MKRTPTFSRRDQVPNRAIQPEKLRWFSATLLFVSRIDGVPGQRPLCEERVVVVRGSDEAQVRRALHRYGLEEEHSYLNSRGESVSWHYEGASAVEPMSKPSKQGVREAGFRITRKSLKSLAAITGGSAPE